MRDNEVPRTPPRKFDSTAFDLRSAAARYLGNEGVSRLVWELSISSGPGAVQNADLN